MGIDETKLSDADLLARCRDSEAALELMLRRYARLVSACARAYYLVGAEESDLIQEGMIGLLSAIRSYDEAEGVAFPVYAKLCIRRRMISAVRAAGAGKHAPLNDSVSLQEGCFAAARDELPLSDPETLFLGKERTVDLLQTLHAQLSPFERQVLRLYLTGFSGREIAQTLGRSTRSAENAIQRIRGKAAALFSGENGNAVRIY